MRVTLRKPTVWIMLTTLVIAAGAAQAQPGRRPLTVRGSTVVFNRPEFDSLVLLEFPFVLNRSEYSFYRPDSLAGGPLYARIFAQINLYGVDGLPLDSANTYFSAAVSDSSEASKADYSLFNSLVLVVQPGIYSARLSVIDAVSKREGEHFIDRINVEPPVKDRLSLGGKCLAFQISYVGQSPAMGIGVPRNGYEVRTNPVAAYSTRDSVAFVYAELYNLRYDSLAPSSFETALSVTDAAGSTVLPPSGKSRRKPGRSAVLAESFEIKGWAPGSYTLQVSAADRTAGQEVSSEIPFAIVAPAPAPAQGSGGNGTDPVGALDLETELRLFYYVLSPVEKRALVGLTDDGKREFAKRFWEERDPDPTTPLPENRLEMYERYVYCNNFFSVEEGKTDGWYTQRGRIYMTYGPPDKLDDYSHPTSGHPVQFWWYYELKEGKVFVFQDEDGFGNFNLVHSTMEGEMFDKRWDAALKAGEILVE
ncbi:MAG: GWxTD domain-containing protein [Candidatus Zixiibacteriota bacterium]